MECPYCEMELSDYDEKTFRHVTSTLLNLIKPIGFVKVMINAGRTIYYDFSGMTQTDSYWYCPQCNVYFISCCHCGQLNCIGSNIMVSPKRITCNSCSGHFVYATHPDPDADHGI